ncbi:MAG: hypothetical protein K0S47_155 [Herbinix sp.]|jgi:8-oxo-dGTP pyrophosphatase MutT (NUDIX family)|nr:hypothetical protein [Herbinix sp.]
MERIAEIDLLNYDVTLSRNIRNAVRAIIYQDNKIALMRSKKIGEYKFPGGGIELGESHEDALVREVLEETGLKVIVTSIHPYGFIHEIRKDLYAEYIFEQYSYYYTCEVSSEKAETNLTESEINYGYSLEYVTIQEALNINDSIVNKQQDGSWIQRENIILAKLCDDKH